MPLRLLAAASRLADAPGAEVVVEDGSHHHPPHAEVPGGARPRSTHDRSASFEASLREAPQNEDVSCNGVSASARRAGALARYLRLRDLDTAPDLGTAASFDGILLAGAESCADIERLGARLAVAEAEGGIPDGTLRIVPSIDTARGVLALNAFAPLPRLAGIACDPECLAASLRCAIDAPAITQARALTVLAAAACGVPAILVVRTPDMQADHEGFGAIFLDDRL